MHRGPLLCSTLVVAVAAVLISCASLSGLTSPAADEGGAPEASSGDAPSDALPDGSSSSDAATGGDADAGPPVCPPGLDFTSSAANCGRCNHDCLGGACVASVCQPVALAINQAYPFGLAVDAMHVYWTTQQDLVKAPRITKAALDGSSPTLLCTTPTSGVTLASDATNIYVTTQTAYGACPKAGGPYMQIAAVKGRGIGADGSFVYVVDSQANAIDRVKPGGVPSLVVTTGSPAEFLAVSKGVVFWTELSAGNVFGCPVGGCMSATAFGTGRQSPRGIAATATTVYWVESTGVGSVQSCPISGCAAPIPVAASQNLPYAVAADSSGVYWTTTGEIRTCPTSGCGPDGPTTLASNQVSPDSIVLDATAVYWANNAKPGQIMRVAK